MHKSEYNYNDSLFEYFEYCKRFIADGWSWEDSFGIRSFHLMYFCKHDYYLSIEENSNVLRFTIHMSRFITAFSNEEIKIYSLLMQFCDINFLTRKLKQPIRAGDIFKINNPQEGFGAEIIKIN